MRINVTKNHCILSEDDLVNQGEYNVTTVEFDFSKEYTDDLVKKALFIDSKKNVYEMVIYNNQCNIPAEVLTRQQLITIGVYAYSVVDDKLFLRYSPMPTQKYISAGSYTGIVKPKDITPSQWAQYQQILTNQINRLEEEIEIINNLDINISRVDGIVTITITKKDGTTVSKQILDGCYFTPHVNDEGDITWTNNGELVNPETQNIRGPQGEEGVGIASLAVKNGVLFVTLTEGEEAEVGVILTDDVKTWIVSQVTNKAESDFNTYYNQKEHDFDDYVENQKNEFNNDTSISILKSLGLWDNTYSENSTYEIGDTEVYDHKMYECITAITMPEEFNSEKWREISLLE